MSSGSNYLTTYYAKRIIGDNAAADSASALLQTGENITTNTWLLGQTERGQNVYGIQYRYDNNGHDSISMHGGNASVATAWVQLDTGKVYILGNMGIGAEPDAHKLYVEGNAFFSDIITIHKNGEGSLVISDGTHYNDDTFRVVLDLNPTSGNHGIWSSGYMNNGTFTSNSTWMLIRGSDGKVQMNGNASTATIWETTRTLTVGATGKSVDGSADISWSMDEIMGSSDSSKFYRGDKTWSNELTGDISIGSRGVTSGPSSITYSNRITIVPYFHTSGPWYIKSGDDASNAYLALYYNTTQLMRIKHDGTQMIDWKGNANTSTKWASAQTVYVTLGTASKTTTIQGGSSSAHTLGVDGTLGVGNGGTGKASWTKGGIIYASATNTLAQIADGSADKVLRATASATYSWLAYTSAATASTIVYRDASKNFSAGTITATFSGNLTGNVTGNCSGSSGSCTGNAATATALTSNAGTSSVPVYFTDGKPVAITTDTANYTTTFTVTGNANTYYPVVFSATVDKTKTHIISVWKNLGSTTAAYTGNHSNGTSSLWLMFEHRNTYWDGNGGYCRTLYYSCPYAPLVAKAQSLGSGVGKLCVWLRGGGTEYKVSSDYNITATPYYASTNVGSSSSPVTIAPETSVTTNGWQINGTFYGSITGNAATATTAAACTGNAATATSAGKWTTARNFTIKDSSSTNAGTAASVDGSGAVTLLLPATIKASITGNCSGSSGSCTGNAATATKATQDGSGNTITSYYVTLSTDQTITGTKTFQKRIIAYGYKQASNLPFMTFDKPGSYATGIGPDGTNNRIHFGPCDLAGTAWTSTSSFNSNEWHFQGKITATSTVTATGFTGDVTGNCSGSSGSCTGNAATATKLETARNINGTSFNGTAAITTANWGTARTLTVGNKGQSVNGSGDVSWVLQDVLIRSGNEFNFTASGMDAIWFNYRNQSGSNTSTKITKYYFGNGQAGTTGVTVYAAAFNGSLVGNASTATTASSCTGNAATATNVAWTGVTDKPTFTPVLLGTLTTTNATNITSIAPYSFILFVMYSGGYSQSMMYPNLGNGTYYAMEFDYDTSHAIGCVVKQNSATQFQITSKARMFSQLRIYGVIG